MSDAIMPRGTETASKNEPAAPTKVSAKHIKIRRSPTGVPASPEQGGKEGKGGGPDPETVTNAAFLTVVFPALPEGARAIVLAKGGDPKNGGWIGQGAGDVDRHCRQSTNNYFNCSSFSPTADGAFRALEEQAVAYHCLVLDDVGTKIDLDALPNVKPTWVLETSPGNFQIGFRLTTPVTDFAAVKKYQKRVSAAGLSDKGAGGPARWMRLPVGINGKAVYRNATGQPFRCRLIEWNPDVSYELDELSRALVGNDCSNSDPIVSGTRPPANSFPGVSADVFRPALPENPVVTAFKDRGLYKRPIAPGRHDVTCPWVCEHTDGLDDGSCFFEPSSEFPLGGFKCHHSHGERYGRTELLKHFELTPRDMHNKPLIRVLEGELHAVVDAAQAVLAATGEFFQAGGLIVKVVVDAATGAASLQPQSDADLTLALSRAADWERCEKNDGVSKSRRCNPAPQAVRLLVQAQSYDFLPVLKGIARQPTIDEAGRLLSVSGYDRASGLYGAFDAGKFARAAPSKENAQKALGRLRHLLREFHFASPRDEATAVSAIFTAGLRPCLGRAPGFHVRAPSPGSGKSLLCDVTSRFAGPGEPAKVSYPRSDDEATKVILAALLQSPAVIDFDDMTVDWKPFGAINRLLTSGTMTDRILGASKMATVSTDTLVLGSGNNTGPTGDLIRRVAVIDLDPGDESPATLRYEGDPLGELRRCREAYVADVLMVVEAWIAAGKPRANLPAIATYGGRWTDFCRQPLVWLGMDDPAAGLIEQLRQDPDKAALGRLLHAWHNQLGSRPVTLRELLRNLDGELEEAVDDLPCVEGGQINRTRLGYFFKRNAGRPVDGLRLEKADSRERNAWRVVQVGERAGSPPPSPPSPPSVRPDSGGPD